MAARPQDDGHRRGHQGVKGDQQVAEPSEGQKDGRRSTPPSGLQAPDQQTQVHEDDGHGQGKGKLAGHGRHEIATHDVERPVEQERQGGYSGESRTGEGQARQAAGEPPGDRHDQQAGHRDPLESQAVVNGDHQHDQRGQQGQQGRPASRATTDHPHGGPAESRQHHGQQRRGETNVHGHHEQHGDHHVEVVGGETGIPVGGPAAEAELGQQLVTKEGRSPNVGT